MAKTPAKKVAAKAAPKKSIVTKAAEAVKKAVAKATKSKDSEIKDLQDRIKQLEAVTAPKKEVLPEKTVSKSNGGTTQEPQHGRRL